jgi:hypothetical protein
VTEVTYPHSMVSCGYWDLAADTPRRRYQIIISGRLGMAGCEAFRDFQIESRGPETVLTGDLNRSGLYDTLTLIRDLSLDLVGLTCLSQGPGNGHQAASLRGSRPADKRTAAEPVSREALFIS